MYPPLKYLLRPHGSSAFAEDDRSGSFVVNGQMTIGLLRDIAKKRPPGQSLLGIDVGKKTLGLAVSGGSVATPLRTLNRTKFTNDIKDLAKIVHEYDIGGFVLGLPLNMDGSEGPRCQSVRDFAQELVRYPEVVGTKPWIALWDERLSTVSVENFVDNSVGINRSKAKERGITDKLAAQLILQGALDYILSCHPRGMP